ncbi:MAG: hypothetical protein FJZ89_03140 [Chloroflexi bacterium]|nr:hypothetical protein [Chloroflexota bacterium]
MEKAYSGGDEVTKNIGNRPAEVFGYPADNRSDEAQSARQRHWCPFTDHACSKKSRLIDHPFAVCSVAHHGNFYAICPLRFEERGSIEGIPRILEDVALHYFGNFNNVIPFPEVRLPNVGSIDYVLVRHKPMKAEVDDFVAIELQTDSTTSTGELVQGLRDFVAGQDVRGRVYRFNMNTYDTIKRSITQLLNKGVVYEAWEVKGYWVIQEYIYANLVKRYGFKQEGYSPEYACRFALYDLEQKGDRLALTARRFVSTTVDEVYQAMRNNPGLPNKDRFVMALNDKLQAKLSVRFE